MPRVESAECPAVFALARERGVQSRRWYRIQPADSFAARIDVHPVRADEAEERHTSLAGKVDRETGWRAHRRDDGDPRPRRLGSSAAPGASTTRIDAGRQE